VRKPLCSCKRPRKAEYSGGIFIKPVQRPLFKRQAFSFALPERSSGGYTGKQLCNTVIAVYGNTDRFIDKKEIRCFQ